MGKISKDLKIEVLHLLAQGYTVYEIAKKLNLSEWEVQKIKDPRK